MRKILVLFFALGMVSTAVQAQFGLRAGLSSANFSDTNFNSNLGFHGGLYYRIDGSFLSIEPGIQYAQKGYETDAAGMGREITETMNYIDVPVLVRLNFIPAINVFAGPQASVLVSRKREEGGDTQTTTEPIKGYDIGAVVGIGVNLPAGFNIQGSYDLGLSSLNYYNVDVKNRIFKVSLGYDF